jgi:DNA-binding transcriptional LysR family regulator
MPPNSPSQPASRLSYSPPRKRLACRRNGQRDGDQPRSDNERHSHAARNSLGARCHHIGRSRAERKHSAHHGPVPVPELTISLLWHPRMDADPAHRWLRELVLDMI